MTKQALRELRDKVAAGAYDATNTRVAQFNRFARDFEKALGNSDNVRFAWQAYNKSQDAAVAFLEAVLPGWWALIDTSGQVNIGPNKDAIKNDNGLVTLADTYCAQADTPARALLLATLDVLIEGAE